MKRNAFILTEILTSMMLQLMFTLTLCAAFYMLLSFSTSTQQLIAAHDDGEVVISYIDSRIRNAGLGLWRCYKHRIDNDVTGVNTAFGANIDGHSNFTVIDEEYGGEELNDVGKKKATDILPVSIVSVTNNDVKISCDRTGRIYEGNVLNLLYAHADTEDEDGGLVLQGLYPESPDEAAEIGNDITEFMFIDYGEDFNKNIKTNFTHTNPGKSEKTEDSKTDIKSWASMEASGVPVHIEQINHKVNDKLWNVRLSAPYVNAKVYPVSELLNIECERIYSGRSGNENSLMIRTLGYDDNDKKAKWNNELPHAKNILELHMILDARNIHTAPIFTLEVLVSEGRNSSGNTQRPDSWPAAYWRDDFANYNVHISRASWRLHNLAPLFPHS